MTDEAGEKDAGKSISVNAANVVPAVYDYLWRSGQQQGNSKKRTTSQGLGALFGDCTRIGLSAASSSLNKLYWQQMLQELVVPRVLAIKEQRGGSLVEDEQMLLGHLLEVLPRMVAPGIEPATVWAPGDAKEATRRLTSQQIDAGSPDQLPAARLVEFGQRIGDLVFGVQSFPPEFEFLSKTLIRHLDTLLVGLKASEEISCLLGVDVPAKAAIGQIGVIVTYSEQQDSVSRLNSDQVDVLKRAFEVLAAVGTLGAVAGVVSAAVLPVAAVAIGMTAGLQFMLPESHGPVG